MALNNATDRVTELVLLLWRSTGFRDEDLKKMCGFMLVVKEWVYTCRIDTADSLLSRIAVSFCLCAAATTLRSLSVLR